MLNPNDPDCQNDIQESRKEHGSLQELPCSPIKEREEVMAMARTAMLIVGGVSFGVNFENDVLQGGSAR